MNSNINLTDLDLMAMFRLAKEMAFLDNDITEEESAVFIKYAQPLNMSESRMDRFINLAVNMDWQNAIDALREMSPELKQYASNFLAEVAMADGEVSDEEDKTYNVFLEICDLPFANFGQDDASSATQKYSFQELAAINQAFLSVWDATNAGMAVKEAFWKQYNTFNEDPDAVSMEADEVESVLYVMSDEKKAEVSRMLLEVIVAKDPDDKVFCDAANIEHYFDLVLSTGLPDLLTDHVLDYDSEDILPDGLEFTLKDLYAVWSMADMKFDFLFLDFVFDESFFNYFHVDDDLFITLRDDSYLEQLDFGKNAARLSRLGANERECVSRLMAETLNFNIGEDDEICDSLDAYKTLVDDYGLPDCLPDFCDGHGMSEYRIDKKAIIRKVKVEPDLFIDGLSQTKIKVTVNVRNCKDGELRLIASVYHADDDSPVPGPDFAHYGKYCWFYGDDDNGLGTLSVVEDLYPSYDDSLYEDLELFLPNDFLPTDRDYYIKVCVFDIEEQEFISFPFHTQKYRFKATKNEWNPDEAWIEPTYMVVRFDKGKHYFYDVVPNCSYTPCTVEFATIPLGETLMDAVKANELKYQKESNTPELNAISRSLDLSQPGHDDLRLAILYDPDWANGHNPLQSLAGNVAKETMVVCLLTPDGRHCGFRKRRQLREVLVALEKHIDGDRNVSGSLAANVWFPGEGKRLVKRRFWDEINTSFYHLKYEVKVSRKAKEISDKSARIDKTTFYRNVMINGVSHTRFTLNVVIYGCKDVKCTCEITFRDGGKYQTAIHCDEAEYCGWFENICLHKEFTPIYDASRYEDLNFDIPDRVISKQKDIIDLVRVEFFTYDGYSRIEIVGKKDFRIKL